MKSPYRTKNEESTDIRKIAKKFSFKSYGTVFDLVVRFRTTSGIEG